jgi:hypothetical protein
MAVVGSTPTILGMEGIGAQYPRPLGKGIPRNGSLMTSSEERG